MCATKTTTAFAGDPVVDLGIAEVRRAVEGGWDNRTHDRTTTAPHSRSVPPTTGVGRAFDDRGDHPVRGCAPHHRTELDDVVLRHPHAAERARVLDPLRHLPPQTPQRRPVAAHPGS